MFWYGGLRAIKRDLAMCTDTLPWLLLSGRGGPMAGQAINYLITARERVGLPGLNPYLPEEHKLRSHVLHRLSRAG